MSDVTEGGNYVVLNIARKSIIVSRTSQVELAAGHPMSARSGLRTQDG